MKRRIVKTLLAACILSMPVVAQAASVSHYFDGTRTEIRGTLYRQTKNTADAATANVTGNGKKVAVTIQAYNKNGNYDSNSWKRNDASNNAYVRSSSSNINLWESAHSTSGTSDKWVWLHVNG